jgi:Zn-dependent metalloprotease
VGHGLNPNAMENTTMRHTTHRHPIFCILPPHILVQIATKGTQEQRDFAIQALELDSSIRSSRATFSLLGGLQVRHEAPAAVSHQPDRMIYDARHTQNLPGHLVRAEGQTRATDHAINEAYDGLGETFEFYLAAYQRNSIDNAGLRLIATVHFGQKYDNAFWNGQQMVFGDGDGVIFNGFTGCLDVIGHELTHGVTGSEVNLNYHGQSGALNESVSDVFGSLVKQFVLKQTAAEADWLIGAGLFAAGIHGVALRSMKAPGTAYDDPTLGKDPQPPDMAHFVHTSQDNGGVHINSGIPNRAFFLASASIGGHAWEKTGKIWYDTICDQSLRPSANFAAFANLTARHAALLYGNGSIKHNAVMEAWKQVGVK